MSDEKKVYTIHGTTSLMVVPMLMFLIGVALKIAGVGVLVELGWVWVVLPGPALALLGFLLTEALYRARGMRVRWKE